MKKFHEILWCASEISDGPIILTTLVTLRVTGDIITWLYPFMLTVTAQVLAAVFSWMISVTTQTNPAHQCWCRRSCQNGTQINCFEKFFVFFLSHIFKLLHHLLCIIYKSLSICVIIITVTINTILLSSFSTPGYKNLECITNRNDRFQFAWHETVGIMGPW